MNLIFLKDASVILAEVHSTLVFGFIDYRSEVYPEFSGFACVRERVQKL